MKIVASLMIVSLLAMTGAGAFAAPPRSGGEAAQVDALFRPWDSPASPGCAVAITKNGSIVYERGYGLADLEHGVKITPTTVFNVGSIAKQFTATAILILAKEGKLSLGDSIRKYLPSLPHFLEPVTLRQMLVHTSGIRDYQQLLAFDGWRLDSPDQVTDGDISYIISRQKELNFPPGTDFSYSNTNYVLLAQVVASVSKVSFVDFMAGRIFQPLQMKQTRFRNDHGEVIANVAFSYVHQGGGFSLSLPNYDNVGDTNLFTTVEDLARWDENFYSGAVSGPELIKKLQEPGELNDATRLTYAPGMFVGAPGGLRIVETGDAGDAGYSANISRFPDYHFSVAVLCNNRPIDSNELSHRVADIYLEGKLSAAISAASGQERSIHIDPVKAGAFVGTYVDRTENLILKIEYRDGDLWAHWFWGPSSIDSRLDIVDENQLQFPHIGEIYFGANGSSSMSESASGARKRSISYRRVPEYRPTAEELREFVGAYSSEELDVPYYLTLEKGGLVIHPPKMPAHPLEPLATDLFVSDGIRVRFKRDRQKHLFGFLMSGSWNRVQNIRFERATESQYFLPIR